MVGEEGEYGWSRWQSHASFLQWADGDLVW